MIGVKIAVILITSFFSASVTALSRDDILSGLTSPSTPHSISDRLENDHAHDSQSVPMTPVRVSHRNMKPQFRGRIYRPRPVSLIESKADYLLSVQIQTHLQMKRFQKGHVSQPHPIARRIQSCRMGPIRMTLYIAIIHVYMKQATALILLLAILLPIAGCLSGAGDRPECSSQSDGGLNSSSMASGGTVVMMAVRSDQISTSSPEAKEWFLKGLYHNTQSDRFEEAMTCFNNSLEIDPDFAEAWCAKGVSLHNLKRYDEALDCYDSAIALDTDNAAVWSLKGTTFTNRGMYDAAEECYQKAALLDSSYDTGTSGARRISPIMVSNNGHVPVSPGRSVMGISVKVDEISTSSPEAKELFIQGLYYTNQNNQFDKALECLNKSLEIDPAFIEAWYVKGVALHNLKRYDEAQYCFDTALTLDPFNISTWFLKGMVFFDKIRQEISW